MNIFILFFITVLYASTCVVDSDGLTGDCECNYENGDCILDYSNVVADTIIATQSANEYYVPENITIYAENEVTIDYIQTKNLTLSGENFNFKTLKAETITFNSKTTVDHLIAYGSNMGASFGVNIYSPNTITINLPVTVSKLSSSINTVLIMNDILTFNNKKTQTFVSSVMMNVLPAFNFAGEKIIMVSNLNITQALFNDLAKTTCKSICSGCNVVIERGFTQFTNVMMRENEICNVLFKGCEYDETSQKFGNIEDIADYLPSSIQSQIPMINQMLQFNCADEEGTIDYDINLFAFRRPKKFNLTEPEYGTFLVLENTEFEEKFHLKNLISNASVTFKNKVEIDNIGHLNNTLTVNNLIADQIVSTELVVNEYLSTNTLISTNLTVKEGARLEVKDGLVILNGTTVIEKNAIVNFTEPQLKTALGKVSKVQASIIYLDGNITIHVPNNPIILGNQQVIIAATANITIVYDDEGMYNNAIFDGIFLFKGSKVPLLMSGFLVKLSCHYPKKNLYRTVEVIPNLNMCDKKGGDYLGLFFEYLDSSDTKHKCQASIVEKRETEYWGIFLGIALCCIALLVVALVAMMMKIKKDKQNEVILS